MAVSYKISLEMFPEAIVRQGEAYHRAVITGMRKTAVFGKTAVVSTIKRTKDPYRIRASGTYEASGNWVTKNVDDGAILAPISKHALFVERGREKGKMPPEKAIREWAFQKGIFRSGRMSNKKAGAQMNNVAAFVLAVRRKIARRGTKARWPLRRTMPRIASHAQREVRRQLRYAAGHKARKRKPPQ